MPTQMTSNEEKTIRSLKTTPTGAINITYYKNGKKVASVGVNKIEDLHEDLVNLFKYALHSQKERVVEMCEAGKIAETMKDVENGKTAYALSYTPHQAWNQALSDLKTKIEEEL